MYDRRVIRGNTYAMHVLSGEKQEEAQRLLSIQQKKLNKKQLRKRNKTNKIENIIYNENENDILETIYDIPREYDQYEQNEEYLDRPPTPIYLPAKILIETGSQVTEDELFNFEYEVKPLLEVLTGKACEQALMEVIEEEEQKNIEQHKFNYEYRRNIELMEVQRLEAADKRLIAEREKRRKQELERKKKQALVQLKIDSRIIAKQIVDELQNNVIKELFDNDYFGDTSAQEIESDFMPWLLDESIRTLHNINLSEKIIDRVLQDAIKKQRKLQNDKCILFIINSKRIRIRTTKN